MRDLDGVWVMGFGNEGWGLVEGGLFDKMEVLVFDMLCILRGWSGLPFSRLTVRAGL